jgi:hypothetical protein
MLPARPILGVFFAACALTVSAHGQVADQARYKILHEVIATQAATRIGMPYGDEGVELSDSGAIRQDKLASEMKKRGESVPAGKFVTVTKIEFSEKSIEIEINGGGKPKGPGIMSKIGAGVQNGIGGAPPKAPDPNQVPGSKIVLKFSGKAPKDLTSAGLKRLLDPILDFGRRPQQVAGVTGAPGAAGAVVDGTDPDADVIKEARIGMSRTAVIQALGRPNNRVRETVEGVEREDWIYNGRGLRTTFVTFENDVVVGIREYER